MLKMALTKIEAVSISCPYCEHPVTDPTPRPYDPFNVEDPVRLFSEDELQKYFNRDDGLQPMCANCGEEFAAPMKNPFWLIM